MNSFLKKYQRWALPMGFGIGFFAFVLFHPGVAQAAPSLISGLTPACMECGNCTLEDGLLVAKNAFTLGMAVVGALVLLMLIYGGFMLLISHGNQQTITYGKGIIGNTFKGLAIFLLAWTIVNGIIIGLAENQDITSWFSFETYEYSWPCEKPQQRQPDELQDVIVVPGALSPSGETGTTGWQTRGIDKRQLDDASDAVEKLVNCLYAQPEIKDKVFINSISDDDVFTDKCKVEKCNRTAQANGVCNKTSYFCYNDSYCVHKCGSCHYNVGQSSSADGFSYAVDIDDQINEATFRKIADPKHVPPGPCAQYVSLFHPEGDHVHLSAVGCTD